MSSLRPPSPGARHFVVTGGAGFIGRRVVRSLLERGAGRVTIIDRSPSPAGDGAENPRVVSVEADLSRARSTELEPHLADATDLIHLAAEKHNVAGNRPLDIYRANVLGTHALFTAARAAHVPRVVFASSLYAYGRRQGPPMVETEAARPATAYGVSKVAGEAMVATLCSNGATRGASLRYFFVYGPGQADGEGYRSLIPITLARLARGEPPVVRGDGEQVLDYVHVDDVVEATLLALDARLGGEIVNVGSATPYRVRDVVAELQRAAGSDIPPVSAPADATRGTSRVANIDRARSILGWQPRIALQDGLADLARHTALTTRRDA